MSMEVLFDQLFSLNRYPLDFSGRTRWIDFILKEANGSQQRTYTSFFADLVVLGRHVCAGHVSPVTLTVKMQFGPERYSVYFYNSYGDLVKESGEGPDLIPTSKYTYV